MNLEQVSHYIAHPHELTLNEAPVLRELSEKHPYSAVFSLLYLTALANGKSVDLDAALQQHAYRLSDRTKLYHLVSSPLEENLVTEIEAASSLEGGLKKVDEETSTQVETPEPITAADEEIASEEAIVEKADSPVTEEQDIEFSSEIEYVREEEDVSSLSAPLQREEIPSEEKEEEEEIFSLITEAFTREQHFDLETVIHEEEVVPEHIPHDEIPEEVNVSVSDEEAVISFDFPEDENKAEVEESKAILHPDPRLSSDEAGSKGEEPVPISETSNTAKPFTSWLKSSIEKKEVSSTSAEKTVEPTEKRSVEEIIDNFIKEEPTITRRKTEFYSPSVKAKESLDEEAMPVSETLAKIYAAQGNYPKAIHVYHQLMLSFPEKKSLFAVQIEALKKKITA